MEKLGLKPGTVSAGVFLIVVSLIFGQGAWKSILSARPRAYGQGYIPFAAACGLFLCGLALLWEAIHPKISEKAESVSWKGLVRVPVFSILLLAAYTGMMSLLGFGLSTFLLLVAFFRIYKVYSWPITLIVSGVFAVGFHYIFRVWLFLPLPLGVFFS